MLIAAVLIDLACNYISHKAKHGEIEGTVKSAVLLPEEVATGSKVFWFFQTRVKNMRFYIRIGLRKNN